ncbi:MAG: response regulator transcription factor [Methylococcaceae bacterium]|nr:response regulator transcription factor [Methylococcaceae bacterium]
MRILVAQYDPRIGSKIRISLLAEGYDVDIATDGETALWLAREDCHSIVVLDIILPKINGFDVCQTLRDNGIITPILMLTNKNTTNDEIDSLETGADDFLRIPFSTPVLLARIRALLRRRNQEIIDTINFGSFNYMPKERKCIFENQEILLTSRESKVLELLILAKGETVSKQTLINKVWGIEFDGDPNIVDVYIGYLRRKIVNVSSQHNILQTIRGVGYRLVDDTTC